MALVRLALQYFVEILVFPVTVLQYFEIWDPLYKKFFPSLMYRITININRKMAKVKKELFDKLPDFASSSGLTVLELGCGTGANFQFFPWGSKVICVDVNPNFKRYLQQSEAKNKHIKIEKFIQAGGEDMGLVASGSIDAVVCTLVLCSVQNIDLVLEEVIRVLKPCLPTGRWGSEDRFEEELIRRRHRVCESGPVGARVCVCPRLGTELLRKAVRPGNRYFQRNRSRRKLK